MKLNLSLAVGASLLVSRSLAVSADIHDSSSALTPRKAFPDAALSEELDKRSIIGDLVNSIINDIENAVTCVGCEALTTALKGVAALGDTVFVAVLNAVCTGLKVQDPDVCAGIVGTEGPVIAEVLRDLSIGSRTNQVLCSSLFGLCDAPAVPAFPGTIPAPSSKKTKQPPKTKATKPLKFVHISDTHIDRQYKVGSNWNCTKPVCCRPYTPSDDVGQTDTPAGPFGHPHCDTPVTLEENLYAAVKQTAPDADFVLFTGDIIDATLWLQNQAGVVAGIKDMYSRMSTDGFSKVYGVIGNHDSAPVNLYPVGPVPSKYNVATPYYNEVANDLQQWIGSAAAASVKNNQGCYSVIHPGTNLKVISVNTNFWYALNLWIYDNNGFDTAKDFGGVLGWLVSELQAAETAGQSVFVTGHMPPGITDAVRDHSHFFNQVVTRYSSTIKGMFFGHTHLDEFEVTYADQSQRSFSNALITTYVTSCVTPRSANPVFRIYTVDPNTYEVLDYDHYYTSIQDIEYGDSDQPVWSKLYNAKSTFGPLVTPPLPASAPLSPAFWHNLTVAFENNDPAFQMWYDRKNAGFNSTADCTGDCKTDEICQMRASSSELSCYKPSFSSLTNRDLGDAHEHVKLEKRRRAGTVQDVHEYLHRPVRMQHGTLQCGGQLMEIFMKMARDKESIKKVASAYVLGHA